MNCNYNPLPKPSWSPEIQERYRNDYDQKYNELTKTSLEKDLKAWIFSITAVALTAIIVAVTAASAGSLPLAAGGIAVIITTCMAMTAVGITASVTGGIWLASEGDEFRNRAATLNKALLNQYNKIYP